MPTDTTEDEVRELFSGIGVIGRIRQKRGYKDQVGALPPQPPVSRSSSSYPWGVLVRVELAA
jgi:hypothetical protein